MRNAFVDSWDGREAELRADSSALDRNRSLLFRDPDGNLVNFFTPVTLAAIEKFAR